MINDRLSNAAINVNANIYCLMVQRVISLRLHSNHLDGWRSSTAHFSQTFLLRFAKTNYQRQGFLIGVV